MNNCKCPYCGKHISYFTALNIRRRGEYYCKKCKKESNVYINKAIWILFLSMMILSLLIMGYFLLMTNRENLWFVLFVAIPFLIFYIFSPAFVRLKPKKKFQDSLYDTDMVNSSISNPDPTAASTAKVTPAFVDDIVLGDEDYKPSINSDIFNAIKNERKVVADVDGGTKSFDKFENISSSGKMGDTRPVEDLKKIGSSIPAEDTKYDFDRFL